MRISRIYQPVVLTTGLMFELSTEAANHLVRVLRHTINDSFVVFNGEGGEYDAKIIAIKKHQVMVEVGEYRKQSTESNLQIHLGQAISRGDKMDYTIQKAVELGVTAITPLLTERCGVKLSHERWDKKLQHWRGVVIAACEQSGRERIPELHEPLSLQNWLGQIQADLKLVLHPQADQTINAIQHTPQSISLLIGPEGGFDVLEIQLAQQAGFHALQLGPRILRTETAALVAITAMQCRWGDLQNI